MEDIYDIKDIFLWFSININYSITFILFLVILFLIYKYLLNKNTNKIVIEEKIIKKEEEIKDFNIILNDFKKKYIEEDEKVFYSKLLYILRWILEQDWNKNISKMTFSEINDLDLDNKLKELIKNLYYKEYIEKIEDDKELRNSYIKEIKKIIK